MKTIDFERTLKELQGYRDAPFPILSIYLGSLEKKSPSSFLFSSLLQSLIHQKLSRKEQKKFRGDIERTKTYLRELWDTRGKRSIAFFSAGEKLWKVLDFEFYLPPLCLVSHSPYLKPVIQAQEDYKKYLVLLVDREKARLFTVHLGNIEEHREISNSIVPQRVRQINKAWMRQDKIFRHIEDHLHRHFELIFNWTCEFVKKNNVGFIIIGTHEELLPRIKKQLPKMLSKLVVGFFTTEVNVPLNKVFLQSKKIAEKIERERIERMMFP